MQWVGYDEEEKEQGDKTEYQEVASSCPTLPRRVEGHIGEPGQGHEGGTKPLGCVPKKLGIQATSQQFKAIPQGPKRRAAQQNAARNLNRRGPMSI